MAADSLSPTSDINDGLYWVEKLALANLVTLPSPNKTNWMGLVRCHRQPGWRNLFYDVHSYQAWSMRFCTLSLAPIMSRLPVATFQSSYWLVPSQLRLVIVPHSGLVITLLWPALCYRKVLYCYPNLSQDTVPSYP